MSCVWKHWASLWSNKQLQRNKTQKVPTKRHEIITKIGCEQLSEDCCNNTCKECPSLDLEGLNDIKEICYYEWIKEKYYKKELIRCSGSDLKEKLTEKLLPLKRHYNKRGQSKKYKEHISNLKGSKFVIHVDYSENCKNKQQREIKSAFYGQRLFTIFTACI